MKECPKCSSKVDDDIMTCPKCGYDFQQDFPTYVSFGNIYMSEIELIKEKIKDKYKVEGFIGKGGFSTVIKLRDIELDRLCALKILSKELISDPEMLERFKREARLYAKLDHPNIVQVYDVGFYKNVAYIIMKYIDGIDLKTYIKENAPLKSKNFIRISKDIASVLKYMHEKGIIHRDIKPANIMIQKDNGKAILTDFGLAKSLETTKFTATGKIMGSPHYLAPEQAKGEPVSKATDIYSLGITMFEMATGQVPFEGETAVQIVLKHIREEVPKPSKVKPDILPEIERIIIKATRKNPLSRYQSSNELLTDLKKLEKLNNETQSDKKKKEKRGIFSYILFFVFLFIIAGGYLFIDYNEKNKIKKDKINTTQKEKHKIESSKIRINQINSSPIKKGKNKAVSDKKLLETNIIKHKKEKTAPQIENSYQVIINSNAKTDVIIDNKLIGTIPPPKTIKLKKGRHKIIFMRGEGNNIKTFVKNIIVNDNKKPLIINQNFDLYMIIKMINAFPWADVYLDNIGKSNYLGLTPIKKDIKIKEGRHKLIFKNKNYEPYYYDIYAKGGEIIEKIHIRLKDVAVKKRIIKNYGYIKLINSTPWGKIYIDDKYYGDTPLRNIKLEEGEHLLKIENSKYKPFIKKIIINKEKEVPPIIINFKKEEKNL